MASLYAITNDLEAVRDLMSKAVDEEGNPRELTDEEQNTLTQWFSSSAEEFHQKFDDYCKFIKNEKIHAENIEAERKNYKAELDRLSARAKVYTNHAERLQAALKGAMEILKVPKMKTELFTANIQNTQYKIEARAGSDLSKVPEVYLKPRELDTKTIKDAIKSGFLTVGNENDSSEYGKVFDETGKQIEGLFAVKGTALVIR